jgi:hypothetical protein
MSRENQREWPRRREDGSERRSPTAFFAHPDGYLKSGRSLAGPLRLGTAPPVGPSGASRNGSSDFGMDRVSPRGFDPEGTALNTYGPQESSPLVSRELRGDNNRRRED